MVICYPQLAGPTHTLGRASEAFVRVKRFEQYFQAVARRGHAYPPPELYTPVDVDVVRSAWRDLAGAKSPAPVGLYVHLPFCERKCSFCYCDTIITQETSRVEAYLRALSVEIEQSAPMLEGLEISTVYVGGGTPTWLSVAQLDALLHQIADSFSLASDVHLNIESTPADMTPEMAKMLGAHGLDRITLGIQALDEKLLASVNRPQSMDQVAAAVEALRDSGVKWINFDLVAGLPGDNVESFKAGFASLLELQPDMVHTYPYTERPGHAPNPEKQAIVDIARSMMADSGMRSLPHDGWGRDPAARNIQVVDKIVRAGSCMGLGIRARSHVFGRLAYSSQSTSDWQARLLAGQTPEYRGVRLTRTLQIQRYLMDNLQAGIERRRFSALFGLDVHDYLAARHPDLLGQSSVDRNQLRLTGDMRSGHDHAVALFSPELKAKLYSKHVGQPKGWPTSDMAAAKGEPAPAYDLNWMHFLALKLSKGNTYPPGRGGSVTDEMVHEAWHDLGRRIRSGEATEAVGLYTHVPYCASICKFCYCYKHLVEKTETLESYVDALIHQMTRVAPALDGIRLNSAYFGGGTPSVLSAVQLDRLLGTMRDHFAFTDDHQFNFEGTPNTLSRGGRLEVLARHGVSRLTVGIQSLERGLLDDMNRLQPDAHAVQAVISEARERGISHINTDLMVGLPGQTLDQVKRSAEVVLGWRPDVVHVYPFQPTSETVYHQEGFRVSSEAEQVREEMLNVCRGMLRDAGYGDLPHESWALSMDARNRQDLEKIVNAASILPLGYLARGHVFGRLSYGSTEGGYRKYMEDRDAVDFYWGHSLELEDDMVRYLISNLRNGISRVEFQRLFREDPLVRFWRPFLWLQERGLVRVTRTMIESRMQSSHESVAFAKVLFGRKHNEALREQLHSVYEPEEDYVDAFRKMYATSF